MGKFVFVLSLFLLSLNTVFGQSYPLGYCSEKISRGVGEDLTTEPYELAAAIQLDAKKLAPFVGGEISAIKVGMISDPDGAPIVTSKDLKVFIRSSLTGEDLYVQKVDAFTRPTGWLEVKLDKPYPIDGKEIFVGYSLTANSIPLGFDGASSPDKRASWVGVNGKWISYMECGNASINAMVTSDKFVQRKVLLEHFTTAACVNCPPVHAMLDNVLGKNENVIWVAHHSGYGTDIYTTNETQSYMWFFGQNKYAPAIMFDRVNLSDYGAADGSGNATEGPVFFPASKEMVEELLPCRSKLPAFTTIIIGESFNPETRELTVNVSGKATIPELLGKNVMLNVFLSEDGLISSQTGAGSKYEHNHVFRASLTGNWGQEVIFDAEGNYSTSYKYTLKSDWYSGSMKIIAFLNNYNSKNMNDCEVYNAEVFDLKKDAANIDAVNNSNVAVYTKNSSIMIDGDYLSAKVYDATGKLIISFGDNQNSCQVQNGIYIVKIINGEREIIRKVAVN